jgi:1-acyl-sn-glycerol-3-phosphate acyltransferase
VLSVADCARHMPRRAPLSRATLFFALYLFAEVCGVAAAGLVWFLTLGGLLLGAWRWFSVHAWLQRMFTSAIFSGALRIFDMTLDVDGREHALPGPFLLFVRHSSTADTVLSASLIANPHKLLLRYVLKRELLWDPCLDIVGQRLPNAFIGRGGESRAVQEARIRALAQDLDANSGVLIYPEGTRYSERKRGEGMQRLEAEGGPRLVEIAAQYKSVLPPRLIGPLALIQAAPEADVLFLEHVGFEGAVSFREFLSGGLVGTQIRARIRRIPAAQIPKESLDVWLFEQWLETDRWTHANLK